MINNRLFCLITVLFIGLFVFSHTDSYGSDGHISYSLDEILEKVEAANSRLKTMDADVKYSRVITLLDSEEVSLGYLQYKKPKKLNLNFFPPRNEINIIDGTYIWIYHLNEKQVEKYKTTGDMDTPQGMDIFSLGYEYSTDKARKDYDITLLDDIETKRRHCIILNSLQRTHLILNMTGYYYGSGRGYGCRSNIRCLRVMERL